MKASQNGGFFFGPRAVRVTLPGSEISGLPDWRVAGKSCIIKDSNTGAET